MSPSTPSAGEDKALAAALGRIPSGLFILTCGNGSAETGMLTSWVQQCSFDPPQVSVAIRPDRYVADWLTPDAPFTLNVVGEGQNALVSRFAKGFRPDEPAFTDLAVDRPEGYAPILRDALAWLGCRVVGRFSAGDHDLFLARVVGGQFPGDGKPWIHVRKTGFNY